MPGAVLFPAEATSFWRADPLAALQGCPSRRPWKPWTYLALALDLPWTFDALLLPIPATPHIVHD